MDEITNASGPQIPFLELAFHNRVVRVLVPILVIGTMAITAAVWYVNMYGTHANPGIPSHALILVPTQAFPFSAMVVDLQKGTTTSITAPQKPLAKVVGIVEGSAHTYYLLADELDTGSNVFVADGKGALKQMTLSVDYKHSLTADEQTGAIAYVAATTTEQLSGAVTLLRSGTSTEEVIAQGVRPTFLQGGSYLIYQSGNELFSYSLGTATSFKLLDIPEGGAYAVDGQHLKIALYDPTVESIAYYTIEGRTAVSYLRSGAATKTQSPRSLALWGDTLVEMIVADQLYFSVGGKKPVGVPGSLPYATALVQYHE